MRAAQVQAEKTAAAAEASKDSLVEALDEQAYRERNGIEVDDDPAVLERQMEQEQALQLQREEQRERSARMDEVIAEGHGGLDLGVLSKKGV